MKEKKIYLIDYYTNKYVCISWFDESKLNIKNWDFLIYEYLNNKTLNLSIWIYLWYFVDTERTWKFVWILSWNKKDNFEKKQNIAIEKFPIFKKTFKETFKNSIPITAKFNIFSNMIHFYFYSEERYNFVNYVKKLRSDVWYNIFLFQVWVRDMVRFFPNSKNYLTRYWMPLHSSRTRPLPSIPIDSVYIQNVDWRDIERLKWWSWKLDESLSYELDLYIEESKKFPVKWSSVKIKETWLKWTCIWFNIITKIVNIKTDEWIIKRLNLDELIIYEYNNYEEKLKNNVK